MKKIMFLLVAMTIATVGFGQDSITSKLTFGLQSGVSLTAEDFGAYDGATVTQVGIPVLATALYRLDPTFEIPNLGLSTIDVGLKVGYLPIFTMTGDYSLTANMFTIPVLAYGRATAGNFFLGIGLGLHIWTLSMELELLGTTMDMGDNGIEGCVLLEPGYTMSINENLAVTGSLSIYNTSYETSSETNDSYIIGLTIGAEYKL